MQKINNNRSLPIAGDEIIDNPSETIKALAGERGRGIELKQDGTVKKYSFTKPQAEKMKKIRNDWKSKYFTARGWNLIMSVTVLFMATLLFWTLRGNHTLQQQLNILTTGF